MHRSTLLLPLLTLACGGGRTSSPESSPAPAARPAAAAEPAALRYGASTGRYRIESNIHSVQEMMGNTQQQTVTTTMILSTTMSLQDTTVQLAATVDSIAASGPTPGGNLASARGRTFNAVFSRRGMPLSGAVGDSADPVASQVGRGVREFLAVLPPGAAAAGASWTDTIADTGPIPGGSGRMSTRSIRQNRVVGWESRDGVQALKVATSGAFTIEGSGTVQGQPIELTGNGTATAEHWISAQGVYLGASGQDSTNLVVNVTSVGLSIPIRQTQRTTVTRLP